MAGTVTVRMYNVGFGDAFLVTVDRSGRSWRMLVDCGVHSQGRARPIADVVAAIVGDLAAVSPEGRPHLDVLVATHHHADHISGFAEDAWSGVAVDEVWLPFVEDVTDPDATRLRTAHAVAAQGLELATGRRLAAAGGGASPAVRAAHAFAVNSRGNARSSDRLLGRRGLGFATVPTVRYLPERDPAHNVIRATHQDVTAYVLGPSRDPADLKRMNPPATAAWLRLDGTGQGADAGSEPLFAAAFTQPRLAVGAARRAVLKTLRLASIDDDDALLAAASILESSVNNTSVFLVLDVAGTRLVFPGDAQQGAWEHVLDDPDSRALVADAAFYKIGHHGSHNATPRRYVEEVLRDGAETMLPYGLVKLWQATIPKTTLLDALVAHGHRVTRADAPTPVADTVTVNGDLWSQVTLRTA